jgi:hypothetical protein
VSVEYKLTLRGFLLFAKLELLVSSEPCSSDLWLKEAKKSACVHDLMLKEDFRYMLAVGCRIL